MTDPTLSPGVLSRLGRSLAEVFAGALDHADMPEEAIAAELSFDRQARAWLAQFEAQTAAPLSPTDAKDPA